MLLHADPTRFDSIPGSVARTVHLELQQLKNFTHEPTNRHPGIASSSARMHIICHVTGAVHGMVIRLWLIAGLVTLLGRLLLRGGRGLAICVFAASQSVRVGGLMKPQLCANTYSRLSTLRAAVPSRLCINA